MFGDQPMNFTAVAAGNLPEQYVCVQGSGAMTAGLATAATQKVLGVAQNAPNAGEFMTVCPLGKTRVKIGGNVAAWDRLTTDSSGRAIAISGAVNSGTVCIGHAMEAGGAGDLIMAFINPFQIAG